MTLDIGGIFMYFATLGHFYRAMIEAYNNH